MRDNDSGKAPGFYRPAMCPPEDLVQDPFDVEDEEANDREQDPAYTGIDFKRCLKLL